MNIYLVQAIDDRTTHYFIVRAADKWSAGRLVRQYDPMLRVFDGVEDLQKTAGVTPAILTHTIIDDKTGDVSHE